MCFIILAQIQRKRQHFQNVIPRTYGEIISHERVKIISLTDAVHFAVFKRALYREHHLEDCELTVTMADKEMENMVWFSLKYHGRVFSVFTSTSACSSQSFQYIPQKLYIL